MKRIATAISILAASMIFTATPIIAADETNEEIGQPEQQEQQEQLRQEGQQEQQGQKDTCLLYAQNCENNTDTIQQRIDRLNNEISKGTAVYTEDELKTLNGQLDELIDVLTNEQPSS